MARNKIITLDERVPHTGEPSVQPVVLWGLHSKPLYEPLSKEASHSPALDYIRTVQPTPGRTVVLVVGLGSFEYYGLNRNADGFPEQPYKIGVRPTCGCCDHRREAWVTQDECVQYHYKSYEQGHVFRHHVNKDPKKRVGEVLKAFWNPFMHRVEVLEDIDNSRAPDLVERIADGEFPAKSMGCRIKFDVCTECGHCAPTRAHYCDHLKFELGRLDPATGIRKGALNPAPRFFDSSWVLRPADRTGYLLKKVAEYPYDLIGTSSEMGDLVDDLNTKAAAAQKVAVIDKVVRGYPAGIVNGLPEAGLLDRYRRDSLPSLVSCTPELSGSDLQRFTPYRLSDTLAALSRAGIVLTTPEFIRLFVEKAVPGAHVPTAALENMTAMQSELFDLFARHPSLLNDTLSALLAESPLQHQEALTKETKPLLEKRSTISAYLHRRLMPQQFRHDEPPRTDLLEVVDPETGRLFQTTRGASIAAEDEIAKSKLRRLLGSAGMLAGAYKVLTSMPRLRALTLPLAAGGLYLGSTGLADEPYYETTSGEQVPYLTEFREKRSHVLDLVNVLGQDYGITKHGAARLQRVQERTSPAHALYPLIQKLASYGLHNANVTLDQFVATAGKVASDGIREEQLDFEKVAEVIGTLAWEMPRI